MLTKVAPVAQLDRVLGFDKGSGFESSGRAIKEVKNFIHNLFLVL